jgi:hypothetical protein
MQVSFGRPHFSGIRVLFGFCYLGLQGLKQENGGNYGITLFEIR